MSHEFVDLLLDIHHGALGQMHIDKCGGNTLMTQECLNDAQMHTGLQKMGSIRVPQGVAADVLAYGALPQGGLEAAVHTLGRNGLGVLFGGEKPYFWPVF